MRTAPTVLYTLSLHDALPISQRVRLGGAVADLAGEREGALPELERFAIPAAVHREQRPPAVRSEEHTSELQSLRHLVCRLLLEKKKKTEQKQKQTQKNINNEK